MVQDTGESAASSYKIVLTGGGISVDRELDTETALAVLELVLGGSGGSRAIRKPRKPTRKHRTRSDSSDKPRRKSRRGVSPSVVKDLSLHPKGKESFAGFAEKKKPRNHFEKQVAAVYWLTKVAGLTEGITVDHINTCYVGAKWKRPASFGANLSLTAARKGWIDTSDGANIQITVPGEDFVDHELPAKKD